MGKDKKMPKNIDDVIEGLAEEHSKNLDEAFSAYDKWNDDGMQEHLYADIIKPGQEKLYSSFAKKLDEKFEDGNAKVHKDHKDIKKAVTEGLKDYFEGVKPSVGKILEELDMNDDEKYDYLTTMYDRHVGADGKNIKSITDVVGLAKDKKTTANQLKVYVAQQGDKYIQGAVNQLANRKIQHHFAKFEPQAVAGYLKPKLEEAGFQIDDPVGYASANLGEHLKLRESLINKKDHPYLKKKEEKKAA